MDLSLLTKAFKPVLKTKKDLSIKTLTHELDYS